MKVFVIAILLLVLLPANALARPATVDEAQYFGRVQGMTALMAPSLARTTDLLAAPDLRDPEWQMNLIAEARLWSAVYQAHLVIVPPAAFAEFDRFMSNSLESADLAGKAFERSIATQSVTDFDMASEYLSDSVASLEQAVAALPEVEFPEPGSHASAETPTPEFKTPLNLDANCDASTMTPAVRVTVLETSIVVSGDGVAFTCFDVGAGEWEMNFACVGDSTGAAMFGTTLKDTIFLSQGVIRSTTIEEPIEVKLLMTCLHKWTYQITKR